MGKYNDAFTAARNAVKKAHEAKTDADVKAAEDAVFDSLAAMQKAYEDARDGYVPFDDLDQEARKAYREDPRFKMQRVGVKGITEYNLAVDQKVGGPR